MSPYFLKRPEENDAKTHVFEDAICQCDGLEHVMWLVVRKGIKFSLVTCADCRKKLVEIVSREMAKVLGNL